MKQRKYITKKRRKKKKRQGNKFRNSALKGLYLQNTTHFVRPMY